MPRKNLIKTHLYYYHVTTRSNHREWFSIPMNEVWEISKIALNKAMKNNPSIIDQYVLMANHYHLLIRTPNSDIDRFMFWFNKTFSDELRKRSGKVNRMFGSSYKWSIIKNEKYLQNVKRYIYENPLRAKIVTNIEDYPFSTLYYKSRGKSSGFKIEKSYSIETSQLDSMTLNDVRAGLKRTIFKPPSKRKY